MFLEDTVSFAEIQPVDFETADQVHRRHLRCISEIGVGDGQDVIAHVGDDESVVGERQRKRVKTEKPHE